MTMGKKLPRARYVAVLSVSQRQDTTNPVDKYRIMSVALTEAHPAKSCEDGERRHRSNVSSACDVEHHKRKDQHHRCLTAHDDKLCDHVGEQYLCSCDT
uniref:Uncharacterized protein n=1 Tax=Timema monikensis TaxID=170555 RepID=A0A7R9HJS1_9NEOP|nr:unnamed protein product [Timema monikensis]